MSPARRASTSGFRSFILGLVFHIDLEKKNWKKTPQKQWLFKYKTEMEKWWLMFCDDVSVFNGFLRQHSLH